MFLESAMLACFHAEVSGRGMKSRESKTFTGSVEISFERETQRGLIEGLTVARFLLSNRGKKQLSLNLTVRRGVGTFTLSVLPDLSFFASLCFLLFSGERERVGGGGGKERETGRVRAGEGKPGEQVKILFNAFCDSLIHNFISHADT